MAEPEFRKSTSSNTATAWSRNIDGRVLVRDSKDPDGLVLTFTRGELAAWIEGCKAGEFDDLT